MNRSVSPSIRRIRATILAFSIFGIVYYIFLMHLVRWWTARVINVLSDVNNPDICVWKHVRPPKTQNAFDMCLRENDVQSNIIRRFGSIDECNILLEQWQKYKGDGIFVDAGANIGECSLTLAANGARVIAFEPQLSNLFYFNESLHKTIPEIKELITIHPIGIGNETAIHTIFVQKGNEGNSVIDIPIAESAEVLEKMKRYSFTIKTETLDNILWPVGSVMPNITLLKLNVQGYEYNSLLGARRLLQHSAIKIIRVKLSSFYLIKQGSSALDICIFLEQYGYALQTDKDTRISPADCVNLGHENTHIIALL